MCESEGVCEVICDVLSDQTEQEESMEVHVSGEEAAHVAEPVSSGERARLSASGHSNECESTTTVKPRYSYRSVFKFYQVYQGVQCKNFIVFLGSLYECKGSF